VTSSRHQLAHPHAHETKNMGSPRLEDRRRSSRLFHAIRRSDGLGGRDTSPYWGERDSQDPFAPTGDWLEVLPKGEGESTPLHLQVLYGWRVWERQDAQTARITW